MDSETIEENYRIALENAEKNFSEGVKKKKTLDILEKEYKLTVKKARDRYNSDLAIWIKKPKKQKQKKKVKKVKQKYLDVEKRYFELGAFQKFKYKFSLFWFKLKFKLHNIFHGNTPDPLAYLFIKIKFHTKRNYKKLKNNAIKTKESLMKTLVNIWLGTKKGTKSLYKWFFDIPGKIFSMFSKKKNEKKEDKKDNQDKDSPGIEKE